MRKLVTIAAAVLALAVPGTALAQHYGDRGGYSPSHDAPRGHDREYRSLRHGTPYYGYDRGYRGYDRRYERRDRYERRYQKRRMHHHHRGRHWRG